MKNNGLISYLYKQINESCYVVSEIYSTNQYYSNNVLTSTDSIALNIINFDNKTSNMLSTDLDQNLEYVVSKSYRNYKLYTMEYGYMNQGAISNSVINYSACSYDNLFKPCGELYPISMEELVPINNPNNSKTFQAYTFNKKMSCNIDGYVSSLITVESKCNNLFVVMCTIDTVDSLNRPLTSTVTNNLQIGMCNKCENQ